MAVTATTPPREVYLKANKLLCDVVDSFDVSGLIMKSRKRSERLRTTPYCRRFRPELVVPMMPKSKLES